MRSNTVGNPLVRRAVRAVLTGGTLATSFVVAHAQDSSSSAAPTANQAAAAQSTAQAPTAQAASSAPVPEVVVTGSRIAVPNATSISPVTFLSSTDIQDVGTTRVADVLNQLPQVFADQNANVSNGGLGIETINLRGLNAKRDLVLVDGSRLGPGDPRVSASDIDMIPNALIQSVEVSTGSSSAIYGADAVSGVVNFKLNDHFEGVKLDAQGGFYDHSNGNTENSITDLENFDSTTGATFALAPSHVDTGAQKELTFIAGLNSSDGKGNATFYATYRNVQAALGSQYSYSACTFASGYLPPVGNGQFGCSGSSTSYPGRFYKLNATGTTTSDSTVGPGGTLPPFTDADRFNYGPLNYSQVPDEEYTAGAMLHYDFNDHVQVYSRTMFMDDKTILQIAPSGAFFGDPYTVNCANPYLSSAEVTAWCYDATPSGFTQGLYIGRRNVEGGNRQDNVEHMDWRETIGVRGDINDTWSYDANFQHSIVDLSDTYLNDVSTTKINYALDVVEGPSGPECAVTAAGATQGLGFGCVPWNIFGTGPVNPAAAAYIDTPGLRRGTVIQDIADLNFNADLGKYGLQLPTASDSVKLATGFEYRDVSSALQPDQELLDGDLAGQGGAEPAVSGEVDSKDLYAEMRAPLINDKPFAQSLDIDTAYRWSTYTLANASKTNTFTISADWAPIEELRFRGSFARSVRAPNVVELFSPQTVALDGTIDPCSGPVSAGGTVNGYTLAQCERTGVLPSQFGHILPSTASQYNGLLGGNPDLKAETALTSSFGVGWQPPYVPGLRAQVDYYDIKIENTISSIGANTILTECLSGADLGVCDLVHRSSIGSLWIGETGFVTDLLQNIGTVEEKGVDIDLSYTLDMGAFGKLRNSLTGTYVNSFDVTTQSAVPTSEYNCVGYYGPTCSNGNYSGTPVWSWRHVFRTTWSTPWSGVDLSLAWRYFSAVNYEGLSSNPNLSAGAGATIANGGISNTDAHIPAYTYIDLTAAMKVNDHLTFRLGCNNVLDKDPPVIGTTDIPAVTGNNNTLVAYDMLGRYIFGELTLQF